MSDAEERRYQEHGRNALAAKTEAERKYYEQKQKNLKNAHAPRHEQNWRGN